MPTRSEQFSTLEIYGRRFRIFYSPTARGWIAQEVDVDGYQIGDAQDAPTRDLAIVYAALLVGEGRKL